MKIDGAFSVYPTDATGRRLTAIQVELRGEFVQDVVARPSTVHILLGRATESEETISLLSLTGSPFSVEGIAAGEGIAVQKVESASMGEAEYRVKLTKTRAEIVNGRIVFKIRENPDSLEYALEVPVAVH